MVILEDMMEAYYDCRRHKRRTRSAVEFEMDYESELIQLTKEVNNRTYHPGTSICFVVKYPRYREVFAARFRDRIIHHYIALKLEPLFEEIFTDRTFNCRKDKGQLYGITMLREDIRRCSEDYTRDCWVMKLDLKGFFMSINKELIAKKVDDFISRNYHGEDKQDLRYLCETVIMHCPEKDCERRSPIEMWDHLPKNKSLFTNGEDLGLAIGNLFSQLFANFLLNDLDHYIMGELGFKHVGRYVDDMYIIDKDKNKMLQSVPKIRSLLETLNLRLNEDKFYIQHYSKGIKFIGSVVKGNRVYTGSRSVYKFKQAIKRLNNAENLHDINKCISSVNSYLGLLRHTDGYAIRRNILSEIDSEAFKYIYIKGRFEVIVLKKRYSKREIIRQNINKKRIHVGLNNENRTTIKMKNLDCKSIREFAKDGYVIVSKDKGGYRIEVYKRR